MLFVLSDIIIILFAGGDLRGRGMCRAKWYIVHAIAIAIAYVSLWSVQLVCAHTYSSEQTRAIEARARTYSSEQTRAAHT